VARRVMGAVAVSAVLGLSPLLLGGSASANTVTLSVTGLRQGSRGDAVRAVQQALVNQGISLPGGADGVFGAGTTSALKAFQTAKGLPATGVVDEATARALGLVSSSLVGLAQGGRGEAVRTLQQKLIAAGIPVPGGADGIFGASTTTALKQFQTANGLAATGTVDTVTAAALDAVTANPAPATTTTTAPDPNATTTTVPTTVAPPVTAPPVTDPNATTTVPTTVAPVTVAAATAASGSIVGLQLGARGDLVRSLQQYLVTVGQTSLGRPDGVFGVRTATALSSFQRSAGLPGNAVVDQATASALLDAVARAGGGTGGAGGNSGSGTPGATSPLLGLKYGSTGAAVKTLQQTLMQAGVSLRGGADGVFGLSTQGALKQYQQLAGLPTSGVVDDATASALASGKSVSGGTTTLVGLKSGSAGNSVKALQQALIAVGVPVRGGADGVFGPVTSQALKTFQTSQGLPATGVVDDATVAALQNPRPVTTPTPPPPTTGSSTGYATFGEKGARVVALQQALVNAGMVLRGGVDGDFGTGTSAAVMNFQRAIGLPITGRVDDATGARLGLAKQDPPAPPAPGSVQLQVFPVQGRCSFVDTWLAARSGGRQHLGVDIIAPQGKAIYAVTDGTISRIYTDYPGSLSGNGVRLAQPDGTYFFYAHMLSLAPGMAVGTPVRAGQIIGYVGTTGSSSTNHLHLEVHPKGGSAINPFPLVKAIDACSVTTVRPQS
jgi:peptidoglycan hydrolase-like protein with peptidoglycan-binding domain